MEAVAKMLFLAAFMQDALRGGHSRGCISPQGFEHQVCFTSCCFP